MDYVLGLDSLDMHSLPLIGGKNAGLGELIRAGIRVPPGFAVTTDAYSAFIAGAGVMPGISEILSGLDSEDMDSTNAASIEIHKLIGTAPLSDEISESIKGGYLRLCERCQTDTVPVAVRSSATAEDLPRASFAGQHDTFLWVHGADRVVERVRQCWAGLFTSRAIAYRAKNGVPHEKALMSVGVQKMVDSRVAGVMFTLNPTNGDPSKVIIEGSWGLGEAIVSGSVNPDKFVIDKVMKELDEKTVSVKSIAFAYDPNGGEILQACLDEEMQRGCCLDEHEIESLFATATAIKAHFSLPMDIEWAIDREAVFPENVFVLQARPETVWSQRNTGSVLGKMSGLELCFQFVERGMMGIKIPRDPTMDHGWGR
ncbi:MAG: phenylphosphate synthase subunit beta [Deltaproteobacteria bacterium]|nr:phenylphosphate synthase subunit beta [Deltaproteobacteria bacterium]